MVDATTDPWRMAFANPPRTDVSRRLREILTSVPIPDTDQMWTPGRLIEALSRAGISKQTFYNTLGGQSTPGLDKLRALAEVLGVPLTRLTETDAESQARRDRAQEAHQLQAEIVALLGELGPWTALPRLGQPTDPSSLEAIDVLRALRDRLHQTREHARDRLPPFSD